MSFSFKAEVLLACNVEEGLHHIMHENPRLIICDYEMPDGNGDGVLSYLRDNHLSTPFIFFTGLSHLEYKTEFPLVALISNKDFLKLFKAIENLSLF